MKRLFLVLLLTSCTDNSEDMKMFINGLGAEENKSDYTIIMSGQSIAQGQYSLASGGYSNEKIFNPNGTYLECKTATRVWQSFRDEMMSPYQYDPSFDWGCGIEYDLGEKFKDKEYTVNIYKPAYGSQKFGTDTAKGKFHVSSSFIPDGEISIDMNQILNEQLGIAVKFDMMLWMHGESDGRDALDSRNDYEMNMRRFITFIRNIYPDLPFYMRLLPVETTEWMNAGAGGVGGREAINLAFTNIAGDTDNCYTVEMPEPFSQGDLIHPSNPLGNQQMADAFWSEMNIP